MWIPCNEPRLIAAQLDRFFDALLERHAVDDRLAPLPIAMTPLTFKPLRAARAAHRNLRRWPAVADRARFLFVNISPFSAFTSPKRIRPASRSTATSVLIFPSV